MTKLVTVAPSSPAGGTSLVNGVLQNIAVPKNRWAPGSLAVALLAAYEPPAIVIITAATLILGSATATQIPAALINDALAGSSYLAFTRLDGPSKSRQLAVSDASGQLVIQDASIVDSQSNPVSKPLVDALILPYSPQYTLASLLNAIVDFYAEINEPGYLIVVDQAAGIVHLAVSTSFNVGHGNSGTMDLLLAAPAFGDVVAEFLLATPTSVTPSGVEPLWGE